MKIGGGGVISTLHVDKHGLFITAKLVLSAKKAAQAYDLAKAGALAFSIGYQAIRKSEKADHRLLEEIDLREISLVSIPANSGAQITSVKSLNSIHDYELHLRESFNLSSREAKRLATLGWKGFRPRDCGPVAELIRRNLNKFGVKKNG